MSVEVDGAYQQYDVTMHIPEESWPVILQPPARHETVPDEKQIIRSPPAKLHVSTPRRNALAPMFFVCLNGLPETIQKSH